MILLYSLIVPVTNIIGVAEIARTAGADCGWVLGFCATCGFRAGSSIPLHIRVGASLLWGPSGARRAFSRYEHHALYYVLYVVTSRMDIGITYIQ